MEKTTLSGIERELVLQYLIDGNVPVTVTPVEENKSSNEDDIQPLTSVVFPVALKAEQVLVLKEGIILLKNPPKTVFDFAGRTVKVEFYFNRVGLYFVTQMKVVSSGPALVIPAVIMRIQDIEANRAYAISAVLQYSFDGESKVSLDCFPANGFEIFSRPAWNTIKLENQAKAKEYLERFVLDARRTKKAGNGIQLIHICRYITEGREASFEAIQGRVKPLEILFLNHERIVLGFEKNEAFSLEAGIEYDVKMKFVLNSATSISRDISVLCSADYIYQDDEEMRFCVDCSYAKIQEEDRRFLYEKATKLLFM